MKKKNKKKYTSIGGQALMEGIMMRGPRKSAMAVRRANGEILLETWATSAPTIWNKIPIIRGIVGFVGSLTSGSKTLMRSAEIAIEDEEAAEAAKAAEKAAEEKAEVAENTDENTAEIIGENEKATAEIVADEIAEVTEAEAVEAVEAVEPAEEVTEEVEEVTEATEKSEETEETAQAVEDDLPKYPNPSSEKVIIKGAGADKNDSGKKDKKKNSDMDGLTFGSVALGLVLAVALFIVLPSKCYQWLLLIPQFKDFVGDKGDMWKSIFEGVIKIIFFLGYIVICSAMEEIRRVFEYHGAEHKTIFCYEAGQELTVENVRKFKRFHPRCGTSFIVLMLLISIAIGICISAFLPELVSWYRDDSWMRYVVKLAVVPLVMGIGYELLKLCGKHDNIITRIICAPGLWMQRITTREPDDGMIECAIAALKEVIPENGEDMK